MIPEKTIEELIARHSSLEKDLVISEAKEILDVADVIASIILVEDLRIQRE